MKNNYVLPANYSKLSQDERRLVRLQYIEQQNGLCYHCQNPLTGAPTALVLGLPIDLSLFPKNFLLHPVHLHHNHETDLTIGAVHAYCNAVLWQYHNE